MEKKNTILDPEQWKEMVANIIASKGWNEEAKDRLVVHDRSMREEVIRLRKLLYADQMGVLYPIAL